MKNWKSKLLIVMWFSGIITILVNFNFSYWGEMAPIYAKGILGNLPIESDGFKLPPLPNPYVNNRTILGLDEDKNGIRDDVDYWIAVNGINYNERMAIREVMKLKQKRLYYAAKDDFDGFQNTTRELWVADGCQGYISSAYFEETDRALLTMLGEDFLYNTTFRHEAMGKITQYGYNYEAPREYNHPKNGKEYESCTFKIKDLPTLIKDSERASYLWRKNWGYEK